MHRMAVYSEFMQKIYIVFYRDDGNREDCSVYYCWLVKATSDAEAKLKVVAKGDIFEDQIERLVAEEHEVLE